VYRTREREADAPWPGLRSRLALRIFGKVPVNVNLTSSSTMITGMQCQVLTA